MLWFIRGTRLHECCCGDGPEGSRGHGRDTNVRLLWQAIVPVGPGGDDGDEGADGSRIGGVGGVGADSAELAELKISLREAQPVGTIIERVKTMDQAKAVLTFVEAAADKVRRWLHL